MFHLHHPLKNHWLHFSTHVAFSKIKQLLQFNHGRFQQSRSPQAYVATAAAASLQELMAHNNI
jgi:hypothetical protein